VDFAWPSLKVIVEIEGGIFGQGRHNRAAGYMADCKKYNTLTMLGWKVLRYCPPDVNTMSSAIDTCLEVKRFLDEESERQRGGSTGKQQAASEEEKAG
jgi:very-short-patch-repair endonuclease